MDLALDEIKPGLTRKADYTSTEQIDLFNRAGGFDAVKREAKNASFSKSSTIFTYS